MSISNPIDALKNIAPRRVDGHDEFRDRRRSRHEALGRIEVGGALVGQHRIGFTPYALKEIASAMGPTRLIRLLCFDQFVEIERFVEAARFERLVQLCTKIRRLARSSQHSIPPPWFARRYSVWVKATPVPRLYKRAIRCFRLRCAHVLH